MAAFTAFYDANVLYPAELRNLLMHLALIGLFRAKWSADVHEEWISSLLEKRPDLIRDKLERTPMLMDKQAVDALDRLRGSDSRFTSPRSRRQARAGGCYSRPCRCHRYDEPAGRRSSIARQLGDGCPPKRNGSTPPVQVLKSPVTGRSAISPGTLRTAVVRHTRWARSRRTREVYTTCWATSGSG